MGRGQLGRGRQEVSGRQVGFREKLNGLRGCHAARPVEMRSFQRDLATNRRLNLPTRMRRRPYPASSLVGPYTASWWPHGSSVDPLPSYPCARQKCVGWCSL